MRQGLLTTALVGIVLAVGGCGDDNSSEEQSGGDTTALKEAFASRSEEAYSNADKSRTDDFAQGVVIDECFVLDAEAATAIGAAAGEDSLAFGDSNFLQGPPEEEEHLGCATDPGDGPRQAVFMITVGSTLVTADQFRERLIRNHEDASEIEGEAEGLDPEAVFAIDGDGISQYVWVVDDFFVGVGGPTDLLSSDEGFAALGAAVEGVESTLTQ